MKQQFTASATPAILDKIDQLARASRRSRSDLVEEALIEKFGNPKAALARKLELWSREAEALGFIVRFETHPLTIHLRGGSMSSGKTHLVDGTPLSGDSGKLLNDQKRGD